MNKIQVLLTPPKYVYVFILCFFYAISANAQVLPDTVSFIHISDTHLIFYPSSYNSDFIQGRRHYFGKANKHHLKSFFKTIPEKAQADFVVITGDLVDFYEAEASSTNRLLSGQVGQFAQLLKKARNVPVYLTLGNHDITSYPVEGFHQNHSERARASWIRSTPSFKYGTYYSRVLEVDGTIYRLIFLDNSYFSENWNNRNKVQFIIDEIQLNWLEYQLQQSKEDVEIIFMHMPLPTGNKSADGAATESHDEYPENPSCNLCKVLKKENASVPLIVAGHWHQNNSYQLHLSKDYDITQVVTGSFAVDENNWRLIQLTDEKIIISNPGSTTNQMVIEVR